MVGFVLWRSLTSDGTRTRLGFFPPRRNIGIGASCQYVDGDVERERYYYYWLEVLKHNPPPLWADSLFDRILGYRTWEFRSFNRLSSGPPFPRRHDAFDPPARPLRGRRMRHAPDP
jgi:hypothetical protein